MKMVVTAARFPYPLDKGDRLTVFHLLKYFSQKHEVSLVCFLEPEQDPAWVEKVAPYCKRVEMVPLRKPRAYLNSALSLFGSTPIQVSYYADPAMHAAMRRVVEDVKPDLLYAQTIRMGQYIVPYTRCARVNAFNVSMTLNHQRLANHASGLFSKMFHTLEYRKMRSFERDFARQFERILLISDHDVKAVAQDKPLDNVFVVPHGVDYRHFTANEDTPKTPNSLIFTGNMGYAPNVDAALYFCQDILPLVRANIPDVTLSIVGTDPTPEIQALESDPAVTVTGRVPDLRQYMNQAQVAVAPIRIGAGLQNKVLEGMSMSLPMVVTSVANEGIKANKDKNILIADKAEHFANHIINLLRQPNRQKSIGSAARDFIVEHWSWEKHFKDQEEMFLDLVEQKKREAYGELQIA